MCKYSLAHKTFFQDMFFIFSSISQENKSLQSLTHFSTLLINIHSTFLSLSFSGDKFAICTSSHGLIFSSKTSGHNTLSKTISHHMYHIFVTCCDFTAKAKALSQFGSFSHLTSQIPGIDLIILDMLVI